jgi:PAS domain S-box-containing protein
LNNIVRVLLVEDHAEEASVITRVLESCPSGRFSVVHCDRLSTTLEALTEENADVVLLDLNLPDSAGLQTVRQVRQAAPRIPVVVLTGSADEELAMEATSEGVQDYLVKGDIDIRLISRSLRYAMQRMRIELVVAEQRRRQRLMMDSIPDCRIYFKDTHGRFLEVNPALAKLYNLNDPQEAVGRTDFDLFSKEHATRTADDEAAMIRTGLPIVGKIERETLADGQVSWALTTKMPLRDERGEIVGTFGLSRDISALKRSEEQLLEANEKLSRAVADLVRSHEELKETQLQLIQAEKLQSLGEMAASVAHELKNPLAILRVGMEFLGESGAGGSEQFPAVVNELMQAVDRAEAVIRDLLNYSADGELALQETPLNSVVEQTLRFVRHELTKGKIKIKLDLASDLPSCRLDRAKFEQVLVNLFTNACHAMPEGGDLKIRSSVRGSNEEAAASADFPLVALEIQDSGTGIPEEKLQQVFEPFFTTKEAGCGTGLGLSVVRKILDLHSGRIALENVPTGGLKVTILLPAVNGSTAPATDPVRH